MRRLRDRLRAWLGVGDVDRGLSEINETLTKIEDKLDTVAEWAAPMAALTDDGTVVDPEA